MVSGGLQGVTRRSVGCREVLTGFKGLEFLWRFQNRFKAFSDISKPFQGVSDGWVGWLHRLSSELQRVSTGFQERCSRRSRRFQKGTWDLKGDSEGFKETFMEI